MNPIIASLHLFTGPRDALNFYNLSSLEIGINLFRSKTHFRSVCFHFLQSSAAAKICIHDHRLFNNLLRLSDPAEKHVVCLHAWGLLGNRCHKHFAVHGGRLAIVEAAGARCLCLCLSVCQSLFVHVWMFASLSMLKLLWFYGVVATSLFLQQVS